jgi:hypothetical protein
MIFVGCITNLHGLSNALHRKEKMPAFDLILPHSILRFYLILITKLKMVGGCHTTLGVWLSPSMMQRIPTQHFVTAMLRAYA